MRLAFRPPRWAWLATALAVLLCAALAAWQWQRGVARQAALAAFRDAGETAALDLGAGSPPPEARWRRAHAAGRWRQDLALQLEGQSHRGRPGMHVWTPLQRDDGALLIVDRGWIPQGSDATGPMPAGRQSVAGWWRPLPRPGLRLAEPACQPATRFPALVLYPTAEQLRCLLAAPVVSGVLLLDADAPGGFVREWQPPGLAPERHYAYAGQWAALALLAAGLFIGLNLRRQA